jgi:uncharacterized protein YjbJ (UPF0337 family)
VGNLGNKADDLKGRAKEAAGDFTDDDDMKREGKLDQAGASAKDKLDSAKDKINEAADNLKDKLDR